AESVLSSPCPFLPDSAAPEIYALSLHDALPIFAQRAPDRFEQKFVLLQQEMAVALRPGEANTLKTVNDLVDTNIKNGEFSKLYQDRKSTRLNCSHVKISYAVFCLKKKTQHLRRC